MIILRKSFSGISEVPLTGTSYQSGQVFTKLVFDPVDNTITTIEESPLIGETKLVKKKVNRVKSILHPIKQLINNKNN